MVSSRQLRLAGLSKDAIDTRVRAGRLHRVHQGIYAVGHRGLSQHGIWMAAVLACHQERRPAFLSHRSAAALWSLLSVGSGPVEVIAKGNGGRRERAGIRLHRSTGLERAATTRRLRIPVTTPTRTIADLTRAAPERGGASDAGVRRAIRQAEALGLPLGDATTDRTKSDLEFLFLRICRRHRLQAPEVNVEIGGVEVDFLWRAHRLIVETDSFRYHRGRIAFERDRTRDLDLRHLGFEVVRFSEAHLNKEPDRVAKIVHGLLDARP